ncbi:hypothetical protein [Halorhodospira halochloris]|nr:hypothetical protein [Halorhodospira halochloris]
MNPSLEAPWRHPWRYELQTGADDGSGQVFRGDLKDPWPRGALGAS